MPPRHALPAAPSHLSTNGEVFTCSAPTAIKQHTLSHIMRAARAHTLARSGGDPAPPGREHDTRHGPVRVLSAGGAEGKGWLGAVRYAPAREGAGSQGGALAGGNVRWGCRSQRRRGAGVFVASMKQKRRLLPRSGFARRASCLFVGHAVAVFMDQFCFCKLRMCLSCSIAFVRHAAVTCTHPLFCAYSFLTGSTLQ